MSSIIISVVSNVKMYADYRIIKKQRFIFNDISYIIEPDENGLIIDFYENTVLSINTFETLQNELIRFKQFNFDIVIQLSELSNYKLITELVNTFGYVPFINNKIIDFNEKIYIDYCKIYQDLNKENILRINKILSFVPTTIRKTV